MYDVWSIDKAIYKCITLGCEHSEIGATNHWKYNPVDATLHRQMQTRALRDRLFAYALLCPTTFGVSLSIAVTFYSWDIKTKNTYYESSGCVISPFFKECKHSLQQCEVNQVDLPCILHQILKTQCKQMRLDVVFTFFCVSLLAAMFPISPSAARGFSEGPVTEQAFPPRSFLVEAKRFCREIQIFSNTSYKACY